MAHSLMSWFGGGRFKSLTGGFSLPFDWVLRQWSFNADAAYDLTLPDSRLYPVLGGVIFRVHNFSASTLTVKYPSGTTLGTIAADHSAEIWVIEQNDEDGVWIMRTKPFVVFTGGDDNSGGGFNEESVGPGVPIDGGVA